MKSVGAALLAVAVLGGVIAWLLRGLDPGVLPLQMAFDARTFADIVHRWPPQGLAAYRVHLWLDFGLLASYAAVGWLLATRTGTFDALGVRSRRWAAWAMPMAAACDAGENIAHLWLTELPRFGVSWVYPLAASLAAAKWVLLLAWLLTLAWALVRSPRARPPRTR